MGKWLEEKTKELAIITSLLDQKKQILDQKKRKLQYVAKINYIELHDYSWSNYCFYLTSFVSYSRVLGAAAAVPEPSQSSREEEELPCEIQNNEQQRSEER